jgi:predicted XRE-type DNA-binding protein
MNQDSDTLTKKDAAIIRVLLSNGFQTKRIAALFDVNQGRISEINSGKKFARKDVRYPIKRRGEDR